MCVKTSNVLSAANPRNTNAEAAQNSCCDWDLRLPNFMKNLLFENYFINRTIGPMNVMHGFLELLKVSRTLHCLMCPIWAADLMFGCLDIYFAWKYLRGEAQLINLNKAPIVFIFKFSPQSVPSDVNEAIATLLPWTLSFTISWNKAKVDSAYGTILFIVISSVLQ